MSSRPKAPRILRHCAFCGHPFEVTNPKSVKKFHKMDCFNAAKVAKHISIMPQQPKQPQAPPAPVDPLDIPTFAPPDEDPVEFYLGRIAAREARPKTPLPYEECGIEPEDQIQEDEPPPRDEVTFSFKAVPEDQIPAIPSLRPLSDHPLIDKRWNGGGTQDGLRYHIQAMNGSMMTREAISQVLDVRLEDINEILTSNTHGYEKAKGRSHYT